MGPLKLYISHAPGDQQACDTLVQHLSPYIRNHGVEVQTASRADDTTDNLISSADVFVMLLSKEYLQTEECDGKQAELARSLAAQGRLQILGVKLEELSYEQHWLKKIPLMPMRAKALEASTRPSQFWSRIADHLAVLPKKASAMVAMRAGSLPKRKQLASALERYDAFLDSLFARFRESSPQLCSDSPDLVATYLALIQQVTGSDAVAWCQQATLKRAVGEPSQLVALQGWIPALLRDDGIFNDAIGSRLQPDNLKALDCEIYVLPVNAAQRSMLLLKRRTGREPEIDEILYFTLRQICILSQNFTAAVEVDALRAGIYDLLKARYQYVSEFIYEDRFRIFCQQLRLISMHFEPIYSFDRNFRSTDIFGWEALARTAGSHHAPVAILQAAELWGTRFKTELDLYVLETAVTTYVEKASDIALLRADEIRPLSVNLYPESLFRESYQAKLGELLKVRHLIPGSHLILEVSEKSIIRDTDTPGGDTIENFVVIMEKLRNEYGIEFAIDDFGAGYSSIVRLNQLKPEWVKIDREVLHCDPRFAKSLIQNLLKFRTEWNQPAFQVVIEGLDSESEIPLEQLVNEVGVKYIQGYLLGKAKPDIVRRPEKALTEHILRTAGWACL